MWITEDGKKRGGERGEKEKTGREWTGRDRIR
jgi:hypothetical protein